jgi:hypothetical protein
MLRFTMAQDWPMTLECLMRYTGGEGASVRVHYNIIVATQVTRFSFKITARSPPVFLWGASSVHIIALLRSAEVVIYPWRLFRVRRRRLSLSPCPLLPCNFEHLQNILRRLNCRFGFIMDISCGMLFIRFFVRLNYDLIALNSYLFLGKIATWIFCTKCSQCSFDHSFKN